jgi:hypothetical protein
MDLLPVLPDLASRSAVPGEGTAACALDDRTAVVLDMPPAQFDGLLDAMASSGSQRWITAQREILEAVHELDMERAAQPPVINVTVTPPDGGPAVPGHFRVNTGEQQVAWVDGPAPEDGPAVIHATRRAAERLRYGLEELPPPEPGPDDDTDVFEVTI